MQCWQSHVLHSLLRSINEPLSISHGCSVTFTIFGSEGHKFDSYVILFFFSAILPPLDSTDWPIDNMCDL